jgi:hypothetical protein
MIAEPETEAKPVVEPPMETMIVSPSISDIGRVYVKV